MREFLVNQTRCRDCGAQPHDAHDARCSEPARLARELRQQFCLVDVRGARPRELRFLVALEATNDRALQDWIRRGGTL